MKSGKELSGVATGEILGVALRRIDLYLHVVPDLKKGRNIRRKEASVGPKHRIAPRRVVHLAG